MVGCWYGYLSGVRCRLVYGPADATASLTLASVKFRLVFTFPVQVHLGSPTKKAIKSVCCSGKDIIGANEAGFLWALVPPDYVKSLKKLKAMTESRENHSLALISLHQPMDS